jgi:CBS domain-containing protein
METLLSELLREKGSKVHQIEPTATVEQAAKEMTNKRIGALLVMKGEELVGIITERDILNRIVADGARADKILVQQIMTGDVVVIAPNRSIRDAMRVVTEKRLRHLPVVKDGCIMGMLSGGDLTRSIVAEEEGVIHTLYDYIYGTYPG